MLLRDKERALGPVSSHVSEYVQNDIRASAAETRYMRALFCSWCCNIDRLLAAAWYVKFASGWVYIWQYGICMQWRHNYLLANVKCSSGATCAHCASLISVPQLPVRHQFILPDHGHGASASRGMAVHFPAEAVLHLPTPGVCMKAEQT